MRLSDGGFEPFGKDFSGAQAAGVQLRLPGQWSDEAWAQSSLGAEIYQNVHRWYEQQTGRYTRPDPLLLTGPNDLGYTAEGLVNEYTYVGGRPTFWIDPEGLEATGPDRMLCFANPWNCRKALQCREAALKVTGARFGSGGTGHNDEADAFRHCYWSCCMAKRMGSGGASEYGTAHEMHRNNPRCEMIMDLYNNAQGRGSGPNGPAGSCFDHCEAAPLQPKPLGPCCATDPYTGQF